MQVSWDFLYDKSKAVAELAEDYTVPYRDITVRADGAGTHLHLPELPPMLLTDTAETQMCNRLEIPARYFRRLPGEMREKVAAFDLKRLSDKKTAFVRSMPNKSGKVVRAFLSDDYVPVDNWEVIGFARGITERIEHKVISSFVGRDSFWLKVGLPQFDQPDPTRSGSVVHLGLLIGNSEVGTRSVSLAPFIHRMICTNDMVVVKSVSFRHAHISIGAQRMRAQMGKVVERMLANPEMLLTPFTQSVNDRVRDPMATLVRVGEHLSYSEARINKLQEEFSSDAHPSRFGVVNAVTRLAQSLEGDARIEMETQAGELLHLPERRWNEFAQAA